MVFGILPGTSGNVLGLKTVERRVGERSSSPRNSLIKVMVILLKDLHISRNTEDAESDDDIEIIKDIPPESKTSKADEKPSLSLLEEIFRCPTCDEKDGSVFESSTAANVRKHLVKDHKYSLRKQRMDGLMIKSILK